MKVLMIVTSHSTLGNSDKKTGLWLEELTTPFYIFKEQGASIVISSPLGGEAPIDPASVDIQHDSISAFKRDTHLKSQLAHTKKLSEIDPSEFDILFFPGGHGPLWDLAENIDTAQIIKQFINAHKVIAAVCHGLAVFKNVVIDNTHYLAGKAATGFSNQEEEIAGLQHIVPFSIQDMLIQNGAEYTSALPFEAHVVTDGQLVTGQNPASSALTALNTIKCFYNISNTNNTH